MKIKLSELANALKVELTNKDFEINAISTNSKTTLKNDLFVPIIGKQKDGHNYISEAISNGAAAFICNKDTVKKNKKLYEDKKVPFLLVKDTIIAFGAIAELYRCKIDCKIIAITGSCGKTTTKEMLSMMLSESHKTIKSKNSFNNEVGVPTTITNISDKHKFAVIEFGAKRNGDISYLSKISKQDMSIITNAAPVHIESMKSMDNIAKIKKEILENFNTKVAINVDDVYAPYWLTGLKNQKIISFGIENKADIMCTEYIEKPDSILVKIMTDIGGFTSTLPMIGKHNIINLLGAISCARAYNISLLDIQKALMKLKMIPRRLSVVNGYNGSKILDDSFNSNPLSMSYSLSVLIGDSAQTRILVIADMLELGIYSKQFHKEIARKISEIKIDYIFTIGRLTKVMSKNINITSYHFNTRHELIKKLKSILNKKTTVLVKGSNLMNMNEIVDNIAQEKHNATN